MMCGGTKAVEIATPEIQALCDEVRPELESKTQKYEQFTATHYTSQVVAGTNYFVKVKVSESPDEFVHLRIFRPLPSEGSSIPKYEENVSKDTLLLLSPVRRKRGSGYKNFTCHCFFSEERIKDYIDVITPKPLPPIVPSKETIKASKAEPEPTIVVSPSSVTSVSPMRDSPGLVEQRCNLRRPTVELPFRLHTYDVLFEEFCAPLILKPPIFDTNAKALRFYNTHYPLLLQVIPETYIEFSDPAYGRRSGSPGQKSPDNVARIGKTKRSTVLQWRTTYLNSLLEELANESGEDFVTELLKITFDPTKWHWNKRIYNVKQ